MSMALNMAEQVRARLEPEIPMETLLAQYLRGGLVHVEPGLVIMAHECHYGALTGEVSHEATPNAWFVRLAARVGSVQFSVGRVMLADFLRVVPARGHEWALWCRRGDGRLRAFRMESLQQKAGRN